MKKILITVVMTAFPAVIFAQDSNGYQCSLDEVTRRVEIFYETGVTVPCEVHYYKDTEMPGERQVLWRAANEEGYCEAKAAEFIEKLRGMGWTCWAAGTTESVEADETDDTEALAPAEEEIEIPESEMPRPN
jgi:hypothetical protein